MPSFSRSAWLKATPRLLTGSCRAPGTAGVRAVLPVLFSYRVVRRWQVGGGCHLRQLVCFVAQSQGARGLAGLPVLWVNHAALPRADGGLRCPALGRASGAVLTG